jgi:acetoin utilization deacetylase AcuC-like enzyme
VSARHRPSLRALAGHVGAWIERLRGVPAVSVWYHPSWRLPPAIAALHGLQPRRADLALWALQAMGVRFTLRTAPRADWADLARVHTSTHLDALTEAVSLSRIFGFDDDHFPVDATLETVLTTVGAVLGATRDALREGGPVACLAGGMHHAFPDRGAGLCPVNDVAIAIAALRGEGWRGRIVILDLDAHPPDGTAACLSGDDAAQIVSISGSDWGALPTSVDETVLPGADDARVLAALDAVLARHRPGDLHFVLAGADVLAGDHHGLMAMTEAGARRRDQVMRAWIGARPSVWLPAGGYREDAWRVLATTVLDLCGAPDSPLLERLDPLAHHFERVATSLDPLGLGQPLHDAFTDDDLDELFGPRPRAPRLLGFYTEGGVELALSRYGLLATLRQLGYRDLRVHIASHDPGDRMTVTGEASGARHLLVDAVLASETVQGERWLVVHWLTLRHPIGAFSTGRTPLPGQEVPGLGMGREAMAMLQIMASRLHLAGVLLRPAWLHIIGPCLDRGHFLDPAVEDDVRGLLRDLNDVPLPALSRAVAEGRVLRDGEPWTWPAAPFVLRPTPTPLHAPLSPSGRFQLARPT